MSRPTRIAFPPVLLGTVMILWAFQPGFAAGQAYTNPLGIYTVKITGKPEEAPHARTYLGIQLLPKMRAAGLVAEVDGNVLTPESFGSPIDLEDPERESYVHVLTGSGKGFIADIVEFRESDIICSVDLTGLIEPGTQILIRSHSHLADIFGAENRFGLAAGMEADEADNVVIWDPKIQKERVYYFHSGRGRWEEKDMELDASRTPIRFPNGIYIVRRVPGNLRLALSGEVGSESVLLPVGTGANVFSLPINLSASLENLIGSEGEFPVLGGPNAWVADLLTFHEPSTGSGRGPFYHLSEGDTGGWREVGANDSNGAMQPLDFLATLVLRRNGAAGFVFARGSLTAPADGPVFQVPPDPEPGEVTLTAEIPLPASFPPDILVEVQSSADLQTWTTFTLPPIENNRVVFQLPPGESRAFYRLKVSLID